MFEFGGAGEAGRGWAGRAQRGRGWGAAATTRGHQGRLGAAATRRGHQARDTNIGADS
jgi:hypothetical protein